MDEMKLKLTTKFMRGMVSKLISRAISKKTGCKVNVHFNDLDVEIIDGETKIDANVELKINSNEFMKFMKSISED